MSRRNIVSPECHGPVVVEEAPRPITPAEARVYYDEFRALRVANAHCPVCGAKYLAWFSGWSFMKSAWLDSDEVCDLSYRRAFNDEPHPDDLPTNHVRRTVITEIRPKAGGAWVTYSRETEGAS